MSQRMRNTYRALTSVVALAALMVAVPIGLAAASVRRFGTANPLHGVTAPWRWIDDGTAGRIATEPLDDDAIVDVIVRLGLVSVWVALVVVVVTTLAETLHLLRHRGFSLPSVRGLGWAQRAGRFIAAGLIMIGPITLARGSHAAPPLAAPAAIAMTLDDAATVATVPRLHRGMTNNDGVPAADQRTANRVTTGQFTTCQPTTGRIGDRPRQAAPPAPDDSLDVDRHVVARGESVYSIAARLAGGDPALTVQIADAILDTNLGMLMPDGQRFTTPAYIEPGWVLVLPGPAESPLDAPPLDLTPMATQHIVETGDTLSSIAAEHLGGAVEWHEIWDENAGQEMTDGRVFDDPDLILPGWQLDLPAAATTGVQSSPAPAASDQPASTVQNSASHPVPIDASGPIDTSVPIDASGRGPAEKNLDAPPGSSDLAAPAAPVAASTSSAPTSSTVPPLEEQTHEQSDDERPGSGAPSPLRIEHAAMLAAGILGLVGLRRHRRLREARPRSRVPERSAEVAATERRLRAIDPGDRAERVDVAVRAAAHDLSGTDVQIGLVAAAVNGDVELRLTDDAALAAPWEGSGAAWALPGDVPIELLADAARQVGAPCVALIQIGTTPEGDDVLIDLEASGLLTVEPGVSADGGADAIVAAIAAGLAASIHAEVAHLITISLPEAATLGHRNAHRAASLDAALELAADLAGSTLSASETTFALRCQQTGGEAWEPVVILMASSDGDESRRLAAISGYPEPGHGLAIVRAIGDGDSTASRLVASTAGWMLEAFGCSTALTPIGLSPTDLAAVADLLDDAARPLVPVDTGTTGGATATATDESVDGEASFEASRHDIVVGLMGPITITDAAGNHGSFERSKTIELIAWLATHREHSTRIAARTALWELDVRDATFANVVSEARRGLARLISPRDDAEWLERTLTEQLPLHRGVVTDAALIRERIKAAADEPPARAIETLRPAVELIRDAPFAGSSYLWPDAEGMTSNLVLLAMSASAELAAHALATDDIELVFWATARGLKVLPGHEELIGLRMKAHARAGDLSGVRCEWEAYERVIVADAWSDGEPAPKLLTLRHELLNAGG